MSEMLAMGGYGAYVWSCFGLTLIVLVICLVQGRRRHEAVCRSVRTRLRAMESDT
jgi:heme exporter protein CcmD